MAEADTPEVLARFKLYGIPEAEHGQLIKFLETDDLYKNAIEIPKSSSRLERLRDIAEAWKQFGRELGVDVSKRLPQSRHVKFLSRENFDAFRRKLYGDTTRDEHVLGEISHTGWIIVAESPSVLDTTNHEIFHRLAGTSFRVTKEKYVALVLSGLQGKGNILLSFNEVITELVNKYVQGEYWNNQLSQAEAITTKIYGPGIIVFDSILQKLAAIRSHTAREELLEFACGALKGEFKSLKKLSQVFGREPMTTLAHFNANSFASAKVLAQDFKVWEDVKDKLNAWNNGEGVEILSGVTRRRIRVLKS